MNLLNNPADTDFRFHVVFSKAIATSTLSVEDFLISGGSYTDAKVSFESNTSAFLIFKPLDNATYTVSLPAGKVTDVIGNLNNASISVDNQRTYDTVSPLVTINQTDNQADPTSIDSLRYIVTFSKKINEATFTKEDIVLSGSATAKVEKITKISDTEFEVEVNNLTDGDTITATIPANVLTDLATNGNMASNSTDNSITYLLDSSNNNTSAGNSGGCIGCFINPSLPASGSFKVIINDGATSTDNRNVNLKFNAGEDIKKIAISMTGDFSDASQEEYTSNRQWDLCSKLGGAIKQNTCPDGRYTVYVKSYTLYGRSSNEALAQSTITLKSGKIIEEEKPVKEEEATKNVLNPKKKQKLIHSQNQIIITTNTPLPEIYTLVLSELMSNNYKYF